MSFSRETPEMAADATPAASFDMAEIQREEDSEAVHDR
uniref:Uncharacterized protein n=1 Tax=Anguilla anguilla TaxID=7936 RepID=A0A0E9XZ35_ANGAN